MTPNNNLSVLPWYTSIDQQNARKWWVYGRVYPLFNPSGFILPFQIIVEGLPETFQLPAFYLHDANTNERLRELDLSGDLGVRRFDGYGVLVYGGKFPLAGTFNDGPHYLVAEGAGLPGGKLYSEVFTIVTDTEPYLKIEWWDIEDFVMDAGAVVYRYDNGQFRNQLYLCADIAKPEYIFEEEGETRDGYFFPVKQISEKRYRFAFLASEYLLDVMRLIRMADYVEITYHGQVYKPDTFLITPEWEGNGDVASVQAEFDTCTVAKKIGRGYVMDRRGDFNDDFNNDYNNQ